MFLTKTRTTLLTLVVAATMAIAALAPAVSQAQYHNYCVAGHCVTHANYTYGNPCTAKSAAIVITEEEAEKIKFEAEQERKKEEEERKKQKGEEKEGEVHQGEIEKAFYGCGVAVTRGSKEVTPPPTKISPVVATRVSAEL
jgi:hypothetical protein